MTSLSAGDDAGLQAISSNDPIPLFGYGTGIILEAGARTPLLQGNPPPAGLQIYIPGGTNAIGFNFGARSPTNFRFFLPTGDSFSKVSGAPFSLGYNGFAFIGFVSPIPLTSLFVTSGGDLIIDIDNFTVGQIGNLPEPASLVMLATGIATVGWLSRKRTQG